MTMINPASFIGSTPRKVCKGTVEVTLNGETRRVYAIRNGAGIQVTDIIGELKGQREGQPETFVVRLILRRNGQEDIEPYNLDRPISLLGKTWVSFTFSDFHRRYRP